MISIYVYGAGLALNMSAKVENQSTNGIPSHVVRSKCDIPDGNGARGACRGCPAFSHWSTQPQAS